MTLTMVRHVHTHCTFPRRHECTEAYTHTHTYRFTSYKQALSTHCKIHRLYGSLLKPEHMGLVCVYITERPSAHRYLHPFCVLNCVRTPQGRTGSTYFMEDIGDEGVWQKFSQDPLKWQQSCCCLFSLIKVCPGSWGSLVQAKHTKAEANEALKSV